MRRGKRLLRGDRRPESFLDRKGRCAEFTATVPIPPPETARGSSLDARPAPAAALALRDPGAFRRVLQRFPAERRGDPSTALLAVSALLEERFPQEAYQVALSLADAHPDQPLPLHLALRALADMGLGATAEHRTLLQRLGDITGG